MTEPQRPAVDVVRDVLDSAAQFDVTDTGRIADRVVQQLHVHRHLGALAGHDGQLEASYRPPVEHCQRTTCNTPHQYLRSTRILQCPGGPRPDRSTAP